jgi:hypothetical protein
VAGRIPSRYMVLSRTKGQFRAIPLLLLSPKQPWAPGIWAERLADCNSGESYDMHSMATPFAFACSCFRFRFCFCLCFCCFVFAIAQRTPLDGSRRSTEAKSCATEVSNQCLRRSAADSHAHAHAEIKSRAWLWAWVRQRDGRTFEWLGGFTANGRG